MPSDLTKMRPIEVCRLMNSTPLGEVLTEQQLRNHRTRAGHRIGTDETVHVLKYVAWLADNHHARPTPSLSSHATAVAAERAEREREIVAGVVGRQRDALSAKQERAIAALLIEPSIAAAARCAGVAESTMYRWLKRSHFVHALEAARTDLVRASRERLLSASVAAAEALKDIVRDGPRDGDRIRAARSILDMCRDERSRHGRSAVKARSNKSNTGEIVAILSDQLRHIDAVDLPVAERGRLTATLTNSLLRAIDADTTEQRLRSLESVLKLRKETP